MGSGRGGGRTPQLMSETGTRVKEPVGFDRRRDAPATDPRSAIASMGGLRAGLSPGAVSARPGAFAGVVASMATAIARGMGQARDGGGFGPIKATLRTGAHGGGSHSLEVGSASEGELKSAVDAGATKVRAVITILSADGSVQSTWTGVVPV